MRPAIKKTIAITAGLAFAVVVAFIALAYVVLENMCANETLGEFTSPDSTQKVVIFERNCGATTAFSWHASLLPVDARLPNKGGNLFVAERGWFVLEAHWATPRQLLIKHDASARVFKAEHHLERTEIRYTTFREEAGQ